MTTKDKLLYGTLLIFFGGMGVSSLIDWWERAGVLTRAEVSRWVITMGRYAILSAAVLAAAGVSRKATMSCAGDDSYSGPRYRDGWVDAGLATLAVWVPGLMLGLLWPVFYTENGPLYHRLAAGLLATFIGGWWGHCEGCDLWKQMKR